MSVDQLVGVGEEEVLVELLDKAVILVKLASAPRAVQEAPGAIQENCVPSMNTTLAWYKVGSWNMKVE